MNIDIASSRSAFRKDLLRALLRKSQHPASIITDPKWTRNGNLQSIDVSNSKRLIKYKVSSCWMKTYRRRYLTTNKKYIESLREIGCLVKIRKSARFQFVHLELRNVKNLPKSAVLLISHTNTSLDDHQQSYLLLSCLNIIIKI